MNRSSSVTRNGIASFALACAMAWVGVSDSAQAVIIRSGNGNTDAASLAAAGGPGNPGQPGFVNVGTSSTGGASVTYLGNRWVLTAAHVTISSGIGPVRFGGVPYTVDDSTVTVLTNPDNTLADLKLFQITTDPGLPAITPQLINSTTPSGRQIMIGNGLSRGDQFYWNVDTLPNPWQWTEQAEPQNPGPNDFSGFQNSLARTIRWGENEVLATSALAYSTEFDDAEYTGVTPLPSEAQLSLGDSGGAVFNFADGQWKLAGIMVAFAELYSGQPQEPAGIPYTVFGNEAFILNLSAYRDQIVSIVPEPTGFSLAAIAGLALVFLRFRRRR